MGSRDEGTGLIANTLLDFVMSLVRDPDAAASYAADPAQALADANLPDVTSVDVNNLIPVVAESLSSAVPSASGVDLGLDADTNVWSSGAATAAFDAFGGIEDQVPVVADELHDFSVHQAVDTLDSADLTALPDTLDDLVDTPEIADIPVVETPTDQDWSVTPADDGLVNPDVPGFDIFD